MKRLIFCAWIAISVLGSGIARADEGIQWHDWSDEVFKTAAKEHKLVLLDLGAVWCHWCHVMDDTTYRNKDVVAQLDLHYIAVRVDQDARPDLSRRYEDYGWPATIIFGADGTEIVKRRGYVDPDTMGLILKESFESPTPNPHQTGNYPSSADRGLSSTQHDMLLATTVYAYDQQHAGWGDGQKFLDAAMMEFALNQTQESNWVFKITAKESLQASYNLIDPVWGGVYQYSDMPDWKSPHFEKILSIQSTYIASYAYAYGVFKDEQYRDAANKVVRYLDAFMTNPDGVLYTSQDADVSEKLTGRDFYPLSDEQRRKLAQPHIDTHVYASENGTMISSFIALYAMTGEATALQRAERAVNWLRTHRALSETGGFAHGAQDKGGPFLADTLAMGKAMLDLYAVTADRSWLAHAQDSGKFMLAHFADREDSGFFTTDPHTGGLLKPYKQMDENIAAARFFNLLSYYSNEKKYEDSAVSALRSITSTEQVKRNSFSPGLLLADGEIKQPPLHLMIVGRKDDVAAQALFKTAIAITPMYKQTEWLDKREGKLPGAEIDYPDLPKAAAFLCTNNLCSPPVYEPQALTDEIEQIR
ncbi:MAG TPA: DUF255 domain-containing protein [Burkholderiaceae bacterium]|jgi:uncharacterized protein YyaL (SSP411 family)|nr:DUF255 domain-containing protein [Burkholderiaceae bacterium]